MYTGYTASDGVVTTWLALITLYNPDNPDSPDNLYNPDNPDNSLMNIYVHSYDNPDNPVCIYVYIGSRREGYTETHPSNPNNPNSPNNTHNGSRRW